MAAIVIVLGLVAVLAYIVCLDVRLQNRPPTQARRELPDEELSEVALTRQLIAGTIDPSIYRRLIGELAHTTTQPDGRRWTSH